MCNDPTVQSLMTHCTKAQLKNIAAAYHVDTEGSKLDIAQRIAASQRERDSKIWNGTARVYAPYIPLFVNSCSGKEVVVTEVSGLKPQQGS